MYDPDPARRSARGGGGLGGSGHGPLLTAGSRSFSSAAMSAAGSFRPLPVIAETTASADASRMTVDDVATSKSEMSSA